MLQHDDEPLNGRFVPLFPQARSRHERSKYGRQVTGAGALTAAALAIADQLLQALSGERVNGLRTG
jgi:hypothetical protein